MISDYPNTLATVVYHRNAPHSTTFGDMRWGQYGGYYIPHSVHDGLYDAWPYSSYESKFLVRQQVTTDVTIDVRAFTGDPAWSVEATICIEPGGVGKDMKIWVVQALDNLGPTYLRRNAARLGNSGVDVTLTPGQCTTVVEPFVLDSQSLAAPEDVKFFVWAQDPVFVWDPNPSPPPNGYYWAEVYQAGKDVYPFNTLFEDGFESGDTTAWAGAAP